jgi:hypothetical protein
MAVEPSLKTLPASSACFKKDKSAPKAKSDPWATCEENKKLHAPINKLKVFTPVASHFSKCFLAFVLTQVCQTANKQEQKLPH